MSTNRYSARRGARRARSFPADGEPYPAAPQRPRPGDDAGRATVELFGQYFEIRFRVPGDDGQRRARSDHLAVEINGEWRRMSLRAALLELDQMVPRVMSRRESVGL